MTRTTIPRPAEVDAFLAVLGTTSPGALTACTMWTAHEVAAHLAAACDEVSAHLRAYGEGRPLTRTRGFEERERPYRALGLGALRRAFEQGEAQVRAEIAAIVDAEPDAVLAWTGRQMRVDAFLTHLRSECALHRWDLVGDDETSGALLGSFDLLQHAVSAIGAAPLTARGLATCGADGAPRSLRVRSEGHPDLVVGVGPEPTLGLAESVGTPTLVADQAARLLLCWGRTPQPPSRIEVTGRVDDARRLRRLLAGY